MQVFSWHEGSAQSHPHAWHSWKCCIYYLLSAWNVMKWAFGSVVRLTTLQYAGQCLSPGNIIVYFVPFCVCIVIKKIHKMLHHVLWYHINISCVLFIRTEAPDRWYHTMVSFMISYMISLYEIIVWYHHMISQHLIWYHDDFYDIILYMISYVTYDIIVKSMISYARIWYHMQTYDITTSYGIHHRTIS